MKIVAIIQARMNSTRLPGKIVKEINKESLLKIGLQRIKKARLINQIILATTDGFSDEITANIADEEQVLCFRGSENDVLDRYFKSLTMLDFIPDYIVRLTADCPLIDPVLIDKVIEFTINQKLEYCSNTLNPTYPDGQDIEVFKFECLKKSWENAQLQSEREHVTTYIWKNSTYTGGKLFLSDNYSENYDYGDLRMTVDEPKDFELVKALVENLGIEKSWLEYSEYIIENKLFEINKGILRNQGLVRSLEND